MSADTFFPFNTAQTDFETGLPLLPFGEFTAFQHYAKYSKQPANVRKLPVLRADFDRNLSDPRSRDVYCGYGGIHFGACFALAFRVQLGADFVYWLANPADQEVWKVLDQWSAARRMVLALDFGDEALVMARDFYLPPQMVVLRKMVPLEAVHTPAFVKKVSEVILKNQMLDRVTTDIPKHPKVRSVQARMVKTSVTGGVAVMMSDADPGDDPVGTALREMAEQVSQPGAPRH